MNKVVFFRVASSGDVAALLGGAQTKYPDMPEDGIMISSEIREVMKRALTIVAGPDGSKSVRGDDAVVVYDHEASTEKDLEAIERFASLGVTCVKAKDPFDSDRANDHNAIGEWIATGSYPASDAAEDEDPFAEMFGDLDLDTPAAPPVPGDEDEPAPAAVEAPSAPEPAPASAAEDFWSNVMAGNGPKVDDQAPPVPGDEDEPAPAPKVDEDGWLDNAPTPGDDDIFDLNNVAGIDPPPVGATDPDVDLSPAHSDQRAPIDDAGDWPPAPSGTDESPSRKDTEESSLAAYDELPPPPEPPALQTPPTPAPVLPEAEAAPARPARALGSIAESTESLEKWASLNGASGDEPAPAPEVGKAAPVVGGDEDSLFGESDGSERDALLAHDEYGVMPTPGSAPSASPAAQQGLGVPTEAERDFAAKAGIPRMPLQGMRKGASLLVTGSHGGCGKTTIAYLMPYVMAYLVQQTAERKPVYLIEADYSNPKLSQRFSLPPEQNSGEFAKFVKSLSSGAASSMTPEQVQQQTREVIDKITYVEQSTGLRVIACPYDTTSRDTDGLRDAIQKLINGLVAREDCLVFIDGQTFAKDDVLDSTLAATADAVVLVGNARHVEDAQSFRHMLTTPVDANGAGVDTNRISVFLNQTSKRRALELAYDFAPVPVVGFLPQMREMDDSTDEATVAWVGQSLRGTALTDTVTFIAQALKNVMPEDAQLTPLIATLADRGIQGDYGSAGGDTPRKKRKLFGSRK